MIIKKGYRKVTGDGALKKVSDIEGWYLFGLIPLYVRVIVIR